MAMSQTVRGIAASFKSGKNQHRPLRDVTFELRAQAQGSSQKPRAMDASGCCIHPMISCYSRTLEIYALGVSPFLGGFTDQLRRKLFPSQDLCPDSVHCCSFGSNQLTRSWCSVLVAQFITPCRAAPFGHLSAEFTIGAIGRLRVRDRTVVDGLLHLAHVTHLTVRRA